MTRHARYSIVLAASGLMLLSACETPIDLDLRGNTSGGTAGAAAKATAPRPAPDARGIISYPGYQVALARRGDTLSDVATRIGVDAQKLARYNGIKVDDTLRQGEVIALPGRVAEPAGGPITPGGVDIASVAGTAIDKADAASAGTANQPGSAAGAEPVRHKVARGETAYTIARLYNVSIRSLADWNGLGADFAVREGQYLLIPVSLPGDRTATFDPADVPRTVETPGEGSPTPLPPSSDKPLPKEDTVAVSELKNPANTPGDAPDLGSEQTAKPAASATRMAYPVKGDIIREYSKGKNDGIDISAPAGSAVNAADSGVVAAITEDTNGTPIIVVKHANNLLTVYSNVENVKVKTGTRVKRGQALASVRSTGTPAVHFQVRDGFESLDPMPYLTN